MSWKRNVLLETKNEANGKISIKSIWRKSKAFFFLWKIFLVKKISKVFYCKYLEEMYNDIGKLSNYEIRKKFILLLTRNITYLMNEILQMYTHKHYFCCLHYWYKHNLIRMKICDYIWCVYYYAGKRQCCEIWQLF